MKRKQIDTVSPDEETGPSIRAAPPGSSAASEPPLKRRRCSTLERGFAHLTLGAPPVGPTVAPVPVNPTKTYPVSLDAAPGASSPMDADMASVSPPLPNVTTYPSYIIEEPSAPDVKMKTSSWYEPEPDRTSISFSFGLCLKKQKRIDIIRNNHHGHGFIHRIRRRGDRRCIC